MPQLKVTERRPPLDSRPVVTGCPCAACLDGATAQLDLTRRTQRASLRDSNSGSQARANGFLPVQDLAGLRSRTNRRRRTHLTLLIESRRLPPSSRATRRVTRGETAFSTQWTNPEEVKGTGRRAAPGRSTYLGTEGPEIDQRVRADEWPEIPQLQIEHARRNAVGEGRNDLVQAILPMRRREQH